MINNVQDIPSDTRSEVIPEEDQNSEVTPDCSDDKSAPPQEDEDLKSQPNQESFNFKLITKSFLCIRALTRL